MYKIRKWSFFMLSLLLVLALAACGSDDPTTAASANSGNGQNTNNASSPAPSEQPDATGQTEEAPEDEEGPSLQRNADGSAVITHVWGTTTLSQAPEKIVSLNFSFTDELVSLGITPTGIAGSYNAEVLGYLADRVGDYTFLGNHQQPNLEVISSLQPDLILANADLHGTIREELEHIAPTVALYSNAYADMEQNYPLLADLTQRVDRYQEVFAELEQSIEQTREAIAAAHQASGTNPSTIVVKATDNNFLIWMPSSYIATLLEKIGVSYSFDYTESDQQQTAGKIDVANVDLETLVQENPEYLVIYGSQADLDKWFADSTFKTLDAVKNDRVLVVIDEIWALGRGPLSGLAVLEEAEPFFGGN